MASSSSSTDHNHFESALKYAMKVMGMESTKLKDGQKKALDSFLAKDTLIVLPTGYGKSIVYQLASLCLNFIQHARVCSCGNEDYIQKNNIAIVISLLTALMSDQVKRFQAIGISVINVASVKTAEEKMKLAEGKYTVVFAMPESLLKTGTGTATFHSI